MSHVNILDCTLRDGGYVNNWEFGYEHIKYIRSKLEECRTDVIELGFMRNETYNPDRAIFNSVQQVSDIIGKKKDGYIYSTLIEMANYFPPEMLPKRTAQGPDAIRYSFWMRCLDEAYEYASQIVSKGYLLGIQPTRVEQYSRQQFADMCERFSKLKPYAIYIVDTFGLLTKEQLCMYAEVADEHVGPGILIGYHAHNNMQQAFSNATTFVEMDLRHDKILDASVLGMGRGAGNLNLEMICNYLNEKENQRFNMSSIYDIWDHSLSAIHKNMPWGYNLIYFITAQNHCNPNYASFLLRHHVSVAEADRYIHKIEGSDKYMYSDTLAEKYLSELRDTDIGE